MKTITYKERQRYLSPTPPQNSTRRPILKCLPPPVFSLLKSTILQNYKKISKYVAYPRFITLGHKTLRNELVRARINPTDEQIIDIILMLGNEGPCQPHTTAGMMPNLVDAKTIIQTCKMCNLQALQHG